MTLLVNHKSEEQRERDLREQHYRREVRAYRWRVFLVFLPWGALLIAVIVTGVLAVMAMANGMLPMIPTQAPMQTPRRR